MKVHLDLILFSTPTQAFNLFPKQATYASSSFQPLLIVAVNEELILSVEQWDSKLPELIFSVHSHQRTLRKEKHFFNQLNELSWTLQTEQEGLLLITAPLLEDEDTPNVLGYIVIQHALSKGQQPTLDAPQLLALFNKHLIVSNYRLNSLQDSTKLGGMGYGMAGSTKPFLSGQTGGLLGGLLGGGMVGGGPRGSGMIAGTGSTGQPGREWETRGSTTSANDPVFIQPATRGGNDAPQGDINNIASNKKGGSDTFGLPVYNYNLHDLISNTKHLVEEKHLIEEQRQLLVETQEQVRVAEKFALTVQIVTEAAPVGRHEGAAPIPDGFAGQLAIDVKAPGLKLLTASSQDLEVPARGSSTRLRFELRAASSGTYTIRVDAWNGPAYLASVAVEVRVEAAEASDRSPSLVPGTAEEGISGTGRIALVMRSPEQGEYTLTVDYDPEKRTHIYRLTHPNGMLSPMTSRPLIETREQMLRGLHSTMNRLARNEHKYDYGQARDWLEGMGTTMFQQLIPEELQHLLWNARHSMSRLNIIAPGAQMPWEMLFLMDPNPMPGSNEPGIFLADTTVVVRWIYGDGAPSLIQRAPAYVVIPANSPPSAQQEHDSVELVCGPPTLVSNLNELRDLTRNGSFRWLHFASHNITLPGEFGTSYIPFGESAFSQELMQNIPSKRYALDRPLIFMNACTTAGAQPLFTETSGWADTFLKRGASAFVGSLWEVRDKSAAAFAHAFYQALKAGKNLGDALHTARAALDKGDPTYLAYVLYGNPRATLK